VGQSLEFQLDGAYFGEDEGPRGPARGIRSTSREVDRGHRQADRAPPKCTEELLAQVPRLIEEDSVVGELVRSDKAPQTANRCLKEAYTHVDVEVQMRRHPVPRLLELGLEAQDPQRVQGVHDRGSHAEPVVALIRDRFQLVLAEGEADIAAPCVTEGIANCL